MGGITMPDLRSIHGDVKIETIRLRAYCLAP